MCPRCFIFTCHMSVSHVSISHLKTGFHTHWAWKSDCKYAKLTNIFYHIDVPPSESHVFTTYQCLGSARDVCVSFTAWQTICIVLSQTILYFPTYHITGKPIIKYTTYSIPFSENRVDPDQMASIQDSYFLYRH